MNRYHLCHNHKTQPGSSVYPLSALPFLHADMQQYVPYQNKVTGRACAPAQVVSI